MAWSEDVPKRFEAYGWHAQRVEDGNDVEAIGEAITAAREDDRPSLIAVRTHIGYGSPNRQDSQKAHGQPLGVDEVRLVKESYGWDPDKSFYVPDDALRLFREAVPAGEALVEAWDEAMDAYASDHPDLAAELRRRLASPERLATGWDAGLKTYADGDEVATRNASQDAIQALAGPVPELFGGAADLSESNLTVVKGGGDFAPDDPGRNVWYGVREHAMGGASNGIAYHGGFIPYAGTFLTFSDYMRGSVRLAALSGLHVIYVWTHDSTGLGEDGPTHQPVEHYAALRAIPNLWFIRPGDANEAAAAWAVAIARGGESPSGPIGLSLTRQKLPVLPGTAEKARDGVARGGYVLREASDGSPKIVLIGTGSELQLAFGAAEALERDGTPARVVSLPCWELVERQPAAYRDSVLPRDVRARVSVEAGVSLGWDRWVGDEGAIVGLDHFGASAPAGTIFEKFGFTVDRVTAVARGVLDGSVQGPQPTLEPGHLPAPRGGHPTRTGGNSSGDSGTGRTDRKSVV